MDSETAALATLFTSAFTSATLLPGSSEAVLAGLTAAGAAPTAALVGVASAGNVLGSCVNWALGRFATRLEGTRWYPSPHTVAKAENWYGRFGYWSLLGSWLPVIGDPLTVVAGLMREPLWRFLLIVTFAKTARYVLVAAGAAALAG